MIKDLPACSAKFTDTINVIAALTRFDMAGGEVIVKDPFRASVEIERDGRAVSLPVFRDASDNWCVDVLGGWRAPVVWNKPHVDGYDHENYDVSEAFHQFVDMDWRINTSSGL